jgi:isocitrate/isopropylmalate dehydrogenase
MLLSASMMLDWLSDRFHDSKCNAAGRSLEVAVIQALIDRITTPDLGGNCTTEQVAEAVSERIPTEVIH